MQFLNFKDNEKNPQASREKKNILQKNKNQIGIRLFIFKNLENNEIMKHCLLSSKRKGFCICNSFIYILTRQGGKRDIIHVKISIISINSLCTKAFLGDVVVIKRCNY